MDPRAVRESAPPSLRDAFEREFEAPSQPVVFRGLAAGWPAVARWDPQRGGLAHLAHLAADAAVEVMLSESRVFSGSTQKHRPTASACSPAPRARVHALTPAAARSDVWRGAATRRGAV